MRDIRHPLEFQDIEFKGPSSLFISFCSLNTYAIVHFRVTIISLFPVPQSHQVPGVTSPETTVTCSANPLFKTSHCVAGMRRQYKKQELEQHVSWLRRWELLQKSRPASL